jgi:hypothetical protein
MGNVKMAGPGFVNDVTAWWPGFVPNKLWTNRNWFGHINIICYCKISSRSEDSLFVVWRLFHTFMYI